MGIRDHQAQDYVRIFGSTVLQTSNSFRFIGSRALQVLVSDNIIDRETFR
jgi:hypothetical protein